MRIVLDTNVFVSGIFFTGPPYQILRAWRDRKIELVVSPEILEEYQRVSDILGRRFPEVDVGLLILRSGEQRVNRCLGRQAFAGCERLSRHQGVESPRLHRRVQQESVLNRIWLIGWIVDKLF